MNKQLKKLAEAVGTNLPKGFTAVEPKPDPNIKFHIKGPYKGDLIEITSFVVAPDGTEFELTIKKI